MIKQTLRENKVKSYIHITEESFPIVLNFHGKEYEIRYTVNGGLIMKGYNREKNV